MPRNASAIGGATSWLRVQGQALALAVLIVAGVSGAAHAQAELRFAVDSYQVQGDNPLAADDTARLLAP